MTDATKKFILQNKEDIKHLYQDWIQDILDEALIQDRGEEREHLIDFVRFLKRRLGEVDHIGEKVPETPKKII